MQLKLTVLLIFLTKVDKSMTKECNQFLKNANMNKQNTNGN